MTAVGDLAQPLGHEIAPGWRVERYGRSRDGVPLRVFRPDADRPLQGLLTAAQHGEEPETLLLARRLLERVPGADARWAIVPVLNPDGLLAGTRQNAAGVDLNRNFPTPSWGPGPSFTFPPGIAPEDRHRPNRRNRSATGKGPASEPETQALMALVTRLDVPLVVDLHAPLELILRTPNAPDALCAALARSASLPVHDEIGGERRASFDAWCLSVGRAALVYEVEHAGLPDLCRRHLPGLEALVRGELG